MSDVKNPSLTAMAFGLQDQGKCPVCQKYYGWNGGWCACPTVKWLDHATRFTFGTGIPPNHQLTVEDMPINIERCDQSDGVTQLWAIRQGGNCLCTDGEWEHEPIPSSRDEEWKRTHRFPSLQAAYRAMELRKREELP